MSFMYDIPKFPWVKDGKRVCSVTHPSQPNMSGHSRGRKVHAAKDDKKSICNMLIDETFSTFADGTPTNYLHTNGFCKVCFKDSIKE